MLYKDFSAELLGLQGVIVTEVVDTDGQLCICVEMPVLGCIKGFMAASLFSTVPIRLYEFRISLQSSLSAGITGYGTRFGTVALEIINGCALAWRLRALKSASLTAPLLYGNGWCVYYLCILRILRQRLEQFLD